MIVSRTPLRVSFFGGGSDLPAYYRREGGGVLSTAIDKSVYVTVSKKFDDGVRVSYSRTEEVATAAEVEHPLVRESLALLNIKGGIEITSVADIPAKGTGLGSSSAFTVGLLNALHAYQGVAATAELLGQQSCHIELERCGEPIGKQDQYAAAFGGFNFVRFNADDTVQVEPVACRAGLVDEIQDQLLFFYTGVTRSASALLQAQTQTVSKAGAKSDDTRELVRLAERARDAIQAGDISPLGPMLDEAWQRKRLISKGVTNPMIDNAYAAAMAAGAQGGKILGAGGGGFFMFMAPADRHDAIRHALVEFRETPFRFAEQGSNIIFVHP